MTPTLYPYHAAHLQEFSVVTTRTRLGPLAQGIQLRCYLSDELGCEVAHLADLVTAPDVAIKPASSGRKCPAKGPSL